ncbi:ribosome-binding factor A [Tautonia sociabilis]|uniref:Ribosome-binding factor A n=1 Tax=Tautonia sociabilis TaxID=2080755 RepID=A0A432MNY0_9BACT|nr:ribosome-binding factor A [Tautonia sociabilis]RUL89144.1 ribosome-binding factor A [Tautonia sociabilis]
MSSRKKLPRGAVDPRRVFAPGPGPGPGPGRSGPKNGRKTMQLCSQVQRTVEQVILGDLDDDVLRNLCVLSVEPAPDDSRLLVTVGPFAPNVPVDPLKVMEHLGAASGHIRSEVAAAITRRKTPTLIYQVAPPGPPPGSPPSPVSQA